MNVPESASSPVFRNILTSLLHSMLEDGFATQAVLHTVAMACTHQEISEDTFLRACKGAYATAREIVEERKRGQN